MNHKLRDITLYYYFDNDDLNKQFTVKQNLVSDLYVHFLNSYKPPKTTRISITLKGSGERLNDPIHFGSILNADAHFDRKTFWRSDNASQKLIILNTIFATVLNCAEKLKWDKDILIDAYNKVKATGFVFRTETKGKLSPNKKLKASIVVEKTDEKSIISACFYDNDHKSSKTIVLFDSFQSEMFYGGIVRSFKWFGNDKFGVYSKTGEIKILANINTGKPEILIEPKQTGREILEGYLRYIQFREFKSDNDFVKWVTE